MNTQTVTDVMSFEYRLQDSYIDTIQCPIPLTYMGTSKTPSREQGQCGSCWAFSIVHTMEDRCMHMNIPIPVLSVSQLLFCDWNDDLSTRLSRVRMDPSRVASVTCFGNSVLSALRYMYVFGVPSDTCVPFSLRTMNARIQDMDEVREIPYCSSLTSPYEDMCADYDMYSSGEVFGTPAIRYRISNIYMLPYTDTLSDRIKYIKYEILTYGAVVTCIPIGDTWFTFNPKTSIYRPSPRERLTYGLHAIEIVGWNEVEQCWWIRNTYGTEWGLNGYCRIAYGTHHIENNVYAFQIDKFTPYTSFDFGKWKYVVSYTWSERAILHDIKYGTLDENIEPTSGISYRNVRLLSLGKRAYESSQHI